MISLQQQGLTVQHAGTSGLNILPRPTPSLALHFLPRPIPLAPRPAPRGVVGLRCGCCRGSSRPFPRATTSSPRSRLRPPAQRQTPGSKRHSCRKAPRPSDVNTVDGSPPAGSHGHPPHLPTRPPRGSTSDRPSPPRPFRHHRRSPPALASNDRPGARHGLPRHPLTGRPAPAPFSASHSTLYSPRPHVFRLCLSTLRYSGRSVT